MSDPDWKKTQKGRIVYDRKKHRFRFRDLYRVTKGSYADWYDESEVSYVAANLLYVRNKINEYLSAKGMLPENPLPEANEEVRRTLEDRLKKLISDLSISMLEEIMELVPGINNQRSKMLSEFIYWEGVKFLDSIIYGGK